MQHLEVATSHAFSSELQDAVNVQGGETIFDLITADREEPWPAVQFTEDGGDLISDQ